MALQCPPGHQGIQAEPGKTVITEDLHRTNTPVLQCNLLSSGHTPEEFLTFWLGYSHTKL